MSVIPTWAPAAGVHDFSARTEAEVRFNAAQMHRKGWHHKSECPTAAALESLHQQAHGSCSIALCRSEPCASLSLDQLRGAA